MFPGAKAPRKIEVSDWISGFTFLESELALHANARALVMNVSGSAATKERYAVWRAVQITHALEIDDTTDPRPVTADGVYYLRTIYFGRVYEVVISGSEDVFTSGVRAELLAWGGSVDGLKRKFKLSVVHKGRGLKPKADAIFARTDEEIRSAYATDKTYKAGKPVPILIEYRRVPGAAVEPDVDIDWKEGAVAQTQRRLLHVQASKSEWTDSGLRAEEGDLIAGTAAGRITYAWGGATAEPDAKDVGGLDMMVGTTTVRAGKTWAYDDRAGAIMFRVRDGKHSDNKGEYVVDVMLVPSTLLDPIDCAQVDQLQNTSPCE